MDVTKWLNTLLSVVSVIFVIDCGAADDISATNVTHKSVSLFSSLRVWEKMKDENRRYWIASRPEGVLIWRELSPESLTNMLEILQDATIHKWPAPREIGLSRISPPKPWLFIATTDSNPEKIVFLEILGGGREFEWERKVYRVRPNAIKELRRFCDAQESRIAGGEPGKP